MKIPYESYDESRVLHMCSLELDLLPKIRRQKPSKSLTAELAVSFKEALLSSEKK